MIIKLRNIILNLKNLFKLTFDYKIINLLLIPLYLYLSLNIN